MKNLINKRQKDKIDSICARYEIKNYTINSDGSIDVDGNVGLSHYVLKSIPLNFNIVNGHFYCNDNEIKSLLGSPKTVNGDFHCYSNKITSLIGSPNHVGGTFSIDSNNVKSFDGAPKYIGKEFFMYGNQDLISTYSGNDDFEWDCIFIGTFNTGLPNIVKSFIKEKSTNFNIMLKYQRPFGIWNDDLSLNEHNFNELVSEIEDGLL